MAPVLQCPDCGARHPIDSVSHLASFRCSGCERVLKVPAQFRPAPVAEPMPGAIVQPHSNGDSPSRRTERAMTGLVPLAWRLIVWLIGLPLGFAIVFGFARVVGVLSGNQLTDLFLDTGWGRFWPVARLLPFVALVTACIVHFSIMFLSRARSRHAVRKVGASRQERTEIREPVRPVS